MSCKNYYKFNHCSFFELVSENSVCFHKKWNDYVRASSFLYSCKHILFFMRGLGSFVKSDYVCSVCTILSLVKPVSICSIFKGVEQIDQENNICNKASLVLLHIFSQVSSFRSGNHDFKANTFVANLCLFPTADPMAWTWFICWFPISRSIFLNESHKTGKNSSADS